MIHQIVQKLVAATPDIEGAAVVSPDGLVLASALPAGTNKDRISAMAAALLQLGARTASELERGELRQVFVKGTDGYTVLMRAEGGCALEVITRPAAKLGMVLLEMKSTTQELNGAAAGAWETHEVPIDEEALEILQDASGDGPAAF